MRPLTSQRETLSEETSWVAPQTQYLSFPSGLNMLVCVHAPRTHAHAHTNTESQLAVVVCTCNNNSWEAEAGGS